MPKKLSYTPRSVIRHALRQVWLRSRERLGALKREQYTCQGCGRKQSKAKGKEFAVQVHHKEELGNWDVLIDAVYEHLLHNPERLKVLCKECHDKEHSNG